MQRATSERSEGKEAANDGIDKTTQEHLLLLNFELQVGHQGKDAAQRKMAKAGSNSSHAAKQGGRAHRGGKVDVMQAWKDIHKVANTMQGEEWRRRVVSVVAGEVDFWTAVEEDIARQVPELSYEMYNMVAPGRKDREKLKDQKKRGRMVLRSHCTVSMLSKQANSKAVPLLSGILGCWIELQKPSQTLSYLLSSGLRITPHQTFSREMLDEAVASKTATHLWQQGVAGFVLDNCGYKLMKLYTSKTNKNQYLQTANHISIELLQPPPAASVPFKPPDECPSLKDFSRQLLLDLDGMKENEICLECWNEISLHAMSNKKIGVPHHHLGPAPRFEVLHPVNLSERQNSSFGHVENLRHFVEMYKGFNDAVGLPLTFIWGDEQVWESIWKLQHQHEQV